MGVYIHQGKIQNEFVDEKLKHDEKYFCHLKSKFFGGWGGV